ncbi:MAG: hypothetical protein QW512_03985 [Thermofilaceae archaeon]
MKNVTTESGAFIRCPVCGGWADVRWAVSAPMDQYLLVHEGCRRALAEAPELFLERALREGWVVEEAET